MFYVSMKNKYKVAVIMSVYNTPFHIVKRAIDSVLNQTFQDFELLIIDDGSSTDSYKLILEYSILMKTKLLIYVIKIVANRNQ